MLKSRDIERLNVLYKTGTYQELVSWSLDVLVVLLLLHMELDLMLRMIALQGLTLYEIPTQNQRRIPTIQDQRIEHCQRRIC